MTTTWKIILIGFGILIFFALIGSFGFKKYQGYIDSITILKTQSITKTIEVSEQVKILELQVQSLKNENKKLSNDTLVLKNNYNIIKNNIVQKQKEIDNIPKIDSVEKAKTVLKDNGYEIFDK